MNDYFRNLLLAVIAVVLIMELFGVGESSYLPPKNVDRRAAEGVEELIELMKHHRRLDDIGGDRPEQRWQTEHKLLLSLPAVVDQLRTMNRELDTLSEQTHRNGLRLIGLRSHYTDPSCTTSRAAAAAARGGQQSNQVSSGGAQNIGINPQTTVGRGAGADGSR